MPQRLSFAVELEHEVVGGREQHTQPGAAAAAQVEDELDAVVHVTGHVGPQGPLGKAELLVCDDALGEVDEEVLDTAVGDPEPGVAQQAATAATQCQGEWPQDQLSVDLATFDGDPVAAGANRHRHSGIFPVAGQAPGDFTETSPEGIALFTWTGICRAIIVRRVETKDGGAQ